MIRSLIVRSLGGLPKEVAEGMRRDAAALLEQRQRARSEANDAWDETMKVRASVPAKVAQAREEERAKLSASLQLAEQKIATARSNAESVFSIRNGVGLSRVWSTAYFAKGTKLANTRHRVFCSCLGQSGQGKPDALSRTDTNLRDSVLRDCSFEYLQIDVLCDDPVFKFDLESRIAVEIDGTQVSYTALSPGIGIGAPAPVCWPTDEMRQELCSGPIVASLVFGNSDKDQEYTPVDFQIRVTAYTLPKGHKVPESWTRVPAAPRSVPVALPDPTSSITDPFEMEDDKLAPTVDITEVIQRAEQAQAERAGKPLALGKITDEERRYTWGVFREFCREWVRNFDLPPGSDQPDRLKLLNELGTGRHVRPLLIMAYEIGSLQRLVARALTDEKIAIPNDDWLVRVAGLLVQMAHAGFPDIAGTYDHSSKWRRTA